LDILQSSETIDLLVSDVGLTGSMNGKQLVEAARMLRPDLQILFITGYADKAADGGSLFASGAPIMTKPFALDDFAQRVASLLPA
jgi:DNA-binding response OmpR family regulator